MEQNFPFDGKLVAVFLDCNLALENGTLELLMLASESSIDSRLSMLHVCDRLVDILRRCSQSNSRVLSFAVLSISR